MTEQQAASSQEPEAQSQVDASQAQGDPASPASDSKTYDEAYVKDLRKEAANYRTRLAQLEKAQKQREDAEKSELEKVQGRAQELEESLSGITSELREYRFTDSIQIPNKEYAWLAAQRYGIEVEFDDNHRPTNADKVAKELAKRDPKLFGAGKVDAGEKSVEQVNGSPANTLAGLLLGDR